MLFFFDFLNPFKLDLRYVPDEQSFEGRTVLNVCEKTPDRYQPPLEMMQTDHLGRTETPFEWDETDPYVF